MTAEETAVADVIATYCDALNASDTDAVMPLYAPDGVFMPPNNPSSVGDDAVRAAYERVFQAITLSVEFNIAEVRQIAPEWAFVRTNSAGLQRVKATGAMTKEANQELFIFQKLSSGWKISRYSFSTTNPLGA